MTRCALLPQPGPCPGIVHGMSSTEKAVRTSGIGQEALPNCDWEESTEPLTRASDMSRRTETKDRHRHIAGEYGAAASYGVSISEPGPIPNGHQAEKQAPQKKHEYECGDARRMPTRECGMHAGVYLRNITKSAPSPSPGPGSMHCHSSTSATDETSESHRIWVICTSF